MQKCLVKLNPHIANNEQASSTSHTRELVRTHPITTATYYVHKFKALMKEIKRDSSIVGKLLDYFFVTEFQHRGSQHDHGLLWIENG